MPNNITLTQMQTLHNAYLSGGDKILIRESGQPDQTLKGLRIPVSCIQDIVNRTDVVVTHFFVVFGIDDSATQKHVTTIFAGIKDDEEDPSNSDGILLTDKLYDFCESCPSICPKGL